MRRLFFGICLRGYACRFLRLGCLEARGMIEQHYSPAQLCKLLSLSRSAVQSRLYDGTFPHVRLGDRILVPESSIKRVLDEGRIGGSVYLRPGRKPWAASL